MEFELPWKHWRLKSAAFAKTSTCKYIEILTYPGDSKVVREGDHTSDTAILDWLEKDLRDQARASPVGGLRLIYFGCRSEHTDENDVVPLTYSLFRAISERLGIPGLFEKCIAFRAPQSSLFHSKNGQQTGLIFKIGLHSIGYFTLALSHNEETRITNGILMAQTVYTEFPRLIKGLKLTPDLCLHPLFLVSCLEDIIIDICHEKLDLAGRTLNHVEDLMGLHPFRNRFAGDPLKLDFVWATRTLNSVSTMVGVTKVRLDAALLVLEKFPTLSEQLHVSFPSHQKIMVGATGLWEIVGMHLRDRVEYLSDLCRNHLLRCDYENQRTQTQLSVVYNYMSQKDSLVNIDIATETKKDSSDMKTIAVLTMVFLPGTFIAAFYAMPLFDWDAAPGSSVLKDRFSYYWIATIPLTITVMLVWTICVFLPWRSWAACVGWTKSKGPKEAELIETSPGAGNIIPLDDWAVGTAGYPNSHTAVPAATQGARRS